MQVTRGLPRQAVLLQRRHPGHRRDHAGIHPLGSARIRTPSARPAGHVPRGGGGGDWDRPAHCVLPAQAVWLHHQGVALTPFSRTPSGEGPMEVLVPSWLREDRDGTETLCGPSLSSPCADTSFLPSLVIIIRCRSVSPCRTHNALQICPPLHSFRMHLRAAHLWIPRGWCAPQGSRASSTTNGLLRTICPSVPISSLPSGRSNQPCS